MLENAEMFSSMLLQQQVLHTSWLCRHVCLTNLSIPVRDRSGR